MKITIEVPVCLNSVGGRNNNEDSVFPELGKASDQDRLFLVCDGVGGAEKGEVASRLVCEAVSEYVQEQTSLFPDRSFFDRILKHAEKKLSEHVLAFPTCFGMKTTLTLLWITQRGIYIGWCGDSRVYQFRNGQVIYRTEDHSLVNEMVRRGELTEEEAQNHPHNNVILRAVAGMDEPSSMDVAFTDEVEAGDIFMLCTDGVNEQLTDSQFAELSSLGDIELMSDQIDAFCSENSNDNYSLYLVQIAQVEKEAEVLVTPKKEETTTVNENDENATENISSTLTEEPTQVKKKEIKPSSENRLLKYVLGGLALIAVLVGGLSFWEYQKNTETQMYLDKATQYEQNAQLDSALFYLKIAGEREPTNSVIQKNLARIESDKNRKEKEAQILTTHQNNLSAFEQQMQQINQDTLIVDSLKMIQLARLQSQVAIENGRYKYELEDKEAAFGYLKFKDKLPFAKEVLTPETWTMLAELYRLYLPNDSIANLKATYCEEQAGL